MVIWISRRGGHGAVVAALLAAALSSGCSEPAPAPATAPVEEVGDEVAILRRLPPEGSGGITEPTRTVVRDAATLDALWRRASSHRAPVPPPPTVDFAKEMVAFVSLGTRPSAGHGIEIVGARDDGGKTVLLILEHKPAQGAMSAAVVTHPWHMVILPRRTGEVEWVDYVPPDQRLGTNLNKR